ncbi:hypothetical protein FA95DRAFT_1606818 [Auriscalpium vulgare]|uniref:Uncharacterized protein n=1 Tax=Auriscalpium vulgare TaxID=40419 RepID=A0ACB8RRM5_9AGAM|nr:hypothetical protein FA95DRAFT_1606818 [Auriscalpium vulgare]
MPISPASTTVHAVPDIYNPTPVTTYFIKDKDFWLRDGSLVLICGDTAFRVHASLLAQHTSLFNVMNTGPNTSTEVLEGCPVYRLLEDASDIHDFLVLLYSRWSCQDIGTLRPLLIGRFLRLADAYKTHDVRAKLVEHLNYFFPKSLGGLRRLRRQGTLPNPMMGVELSYAYAIPSVLPAALYMTALLPESMYVGYFKRVRTPLAFEALEAIASFKRRFIEIGTSSAYASNGTALATQPCVSGNAACPGLTARTLRSAMRLYALFKVAVIVNMGYICEAGRVLCENCVQEWDRRAEEMQDGLWSVVLKLTEGGQGNTQ